jgi:hypothetical protein
LPSKAASKEIQSPCFSRDPQLVRVELAGVRGNAASQGGELVVVLDSGRKIEVPEGFDELTLQRLVRVLECFKLCLDWVQRRGSI